MFDGLNTNVNCMYLLVPSFTVFDKRFEQLNCQNYKICLKGVLLYANLQRLWGFYVIFQFVLQKKNEKFFGKC